MPPRAKKTGPTEVPENSASKVQRHMTKFLTGQLLKLSQEASTAAATKQAAPAKTKPKAAAQNDDAQTSTANKPHAVQQTKIPSKKRVADDMDSVLKPFYYSKSLTDPINTSRHEGDVERLSPEVEVLHLYVRNDSLCKLVQGLLFWCLLWAAEAREFVTLGL
jgi:hypothetical protein